MKLRKNKFRYRMPEYSEIQSVIIKRNQKNNQMYTIRLLQIPCNEISTETGPPRFFALVKDCIEFCPIPDKSYEISIRYFPPLKEA